MGMNVLQRGRATGIRVYTDQILGIQPPCHMVYTSVPQIPERGNRAIQICSQEGSKYAAARKSQEVVVVVTSNCCTSSK